MASIGPQLPPHLQKRKRTPEDNDQPSSPPAKVTRRDNNDEIDLNDSDSDSDDGYGPSLPKSKPSIGPSLPSSNLSPQLKSTERPVAKLSIGPSPPPAPSTNQDEIALEDSDSNYGPQPLPVSNTAATATSGLSPRRILGPAPPPADLSQRPLTNPDSDSDSEDEWGPSLPGAAPSKPASTSSHGPSLPSAPAPPKRDDWMIAPPTSSGYRAPDPTKLKNRKFASGPRAVTEVKAGGVSSIWTETPEEKARRLANAVLGREDPNNPSTPAAGSSSSDSKKRSKYSAEDEAQIRAYTEQTRGKSLVEQHQERKAEVKKQRGGEFKPGEEEDDPSKRAFDWGKDMKVGGSISGSQKKQILNKAANFGGRFQKGSYL